jgi:hypothetical protein
LGQSEDLLFISKIAQAFQLCIAPRKICITIHVFLVSLLSQYELFEDYIFIINAHTIVRAYGVVQKQIEQMQVHMIALLVWITIWSHST